MKISILFSQGYTEIKVDGELGIVYLLLSGQFGSDALRLFRDEELMNTIYPILYDSLEDIKHTPPGRIKEILAVKILKSLRDMIRGDDSNAFNITYIMEFVGKWCVGLGTKPFIQSNGSVRV